MAESWDCGCSSGWDSLFQMHTAAGPRGPRAQAFCRRHLVFSPCPTGPDRAQHSLSLCKAGTVAMTQRKAHDVLRRPRLRHQDPLFDCVTLCGTPLPFSLGTFQPFSPSVLASPPSLVVIWLWFRNRMEEAHPLFSGVRQPPHRTC